MDEQIQIVRWIDEQLTAMEAVNHDARTAITRVSVLRRTLLRAAFSGSLTDSPTSRPHLESASV